MFQYFRKVLYVLSGKKTKLILLLLLLVGTSFLEAFGIGLIGPFIKIASEPETVHTIPLLKHAYALSGMTSESQFIPVLGGIVIAIFFIKSIAYFLSRSYILHFSFQQKELLVLRLLKAYLSVPYTFHLKRNTASLIKNIIVEVNQFAQNSLLQSLNAVSSLIIIISLLILLANTSALLLVMILAAIFPLIIFFKVFGKRFRQWGKTRSKANQEMIRVLNHSLGSVKETRLIGCEPYFNDKMKEQGRLYARSSTLFASSQLLPRILIESLLIIFVVGFISFYTVFSQQNIQELTAILSVFAVAALRLIPATNQFAKSVSSIQNSGYTLNLLYNDLKSLDKEDLKKAQKLQTALPTERVLSSDNGGLSVNSPLDSPSRRIDQASFAEANPAKASLAFNQSVTLNNIRYSYPGAAGEAIKGISLTLRKGQSIALIGKSGAGKTTLVDILLGLLIPAHGDIQVDGRSIYNNIRAWQNLVGYIPQSIFLIDDTVERNIAFGVPDALIDHKKVEDSIKAAQLESLMEELPEGLQTGVGERGVRLSGGQRQRIGIARALYHDSEILVLDEATSALDSETEQQISEAINALSGSKTLIIIAHRLSTVEHCDCLYMLHSGEVVDSGKYHEVVAAKAWEVHA